MRNGRIQGVLGEEKCFLKGLLESIVMGWATEMGRDGLRLVLIHKRLTQRAGLKGLGPNLTSRKRPGNGGLG